MWCLVGAPFRLGCSIIFFCLHSFILIVFIALALLVEFDDLIVGVVQCIYMDGKKSDGTIYSI